jgi:hypothetical protein
MDSCLINAFAYVLSFVGTTNAIKGKQSKANALGE